MSMATKPGANVVTNTRKRPSTADPDADRGHRTTHSRDELRARLEATNVV
jgi:hypothetical protein